MSGLAAITRFDVGSYVATVFSVYILLVIARIVIGWVEMARGSIPYYRPLRLLTDFVLEVVDPLLNRLRRHLPMLNFGGMGLDLSPVVAILGLGILQQIVVSLIEG